MIAVMKSVLPRICEKVTNGDCTILVSKTSPKCEVPFKCYIYMTATKERFYLWEYVTAYENSKGEILDGSQKVIGEFVCDKVFLLHPYTYDRGSADLERRKFIQTFEGSSRENEILAATCLTQDEMFDYIGAGNYGYGWHISDLKIYGKPKELSEFYTIDESGNDCCIACVHHETPIEEMPCRTCTGERRYLYRAPQSWQYVEEI